MDFNFIRQEIDELYSLTSYDPIIYQKILELATKSYEEWIKHCSRFIN